MIFSKITLNLISIEGSFCFISIIVHILLNLFTIISMVEDNLNFVQRNIKRIDWLCEILWFLRNLGCFNPFKVPSWIESTSLGKSCIGAVYFIRKPSWACDFSSRLLNLSWWCNRWDFEKHASAEDQNSQKGEDTTCWAGNGFSTIITQINNRLFEHIDVLKDCVTSITTGVEAFTFFLCTLRVLTLCLFLILHLSM